MAGRKTVLTEELIVKIATMIKGGAYAWVAATAAGVSRSTFFSWLQQAEQPGADALLVEFLDAIEEAKGIARATAEITIKKERPEIWLMRGPGKNKPGLEGWSAENSLTLQVGNQPLKLSWDDDDNANTIAETPRITEVSEG